MIKRRIKSWTKDTIVRCCNSSIIQNTARWLHRSKTIFLAYHGVSRDKEEFNAWTLVPETTFRQQMAYVKNNFQCLTIDEALNPNGRDLTQPGMVVTFDDGYANNLEIALPILEEFNIPAIIYITTRTILEKKLLWSDIIWIAANQSGINSINLKDIGNPLGCYRLKTGGDIFQESCLRILEDIKRTDPELREDIVQAIECKFKNSPRAKYFNIQVENNVFTPLNPEQVSMLSSHPLITIGAHSHCHNLLDQISLEQAKKSVEKSKEILERITGEMVEHFAYPNGNFNAELMKIVKNEGFKSAVTFQSGFFRKGDSPYCIKRFGVGENMSIDLFKALLTGVFVFTRKFIP